MENSDFHQPRFFLSVKNKKCNYFHMDCAQSMQTLTYVHVDVSPGLDLWFMCEHVYIKGVRMHT